jgi:hypothetical protein
MRKTPSKIEVTPAITHVITALAGLQEIAATAETIPKRPKC